MKNLDAIFSQDQTNNAENVNPDLPMIPLSTILKCTDNFSDNYKLGEGGFGAVYKVHDIFLFDFSYCGILTKKFGKCFRVF